uniref:Uncharacterized protein n=1 Tax=Arundo donax TaxID=35708 RepID=A0A0A9DQE2_ARUDO
MPRLSISLIIAAAESIRRDLIKSTTTVLNDILSISTSAHSMSVSNCLTACRSLALQSPQSITL